MRFFVCNYNNYVCNKIARDAEKDERFIEYG